MQISQILQKILHLELKIKFELEPVLLAKTNLDSTPFFPTIGSVKIYNPTGKYFMNIL